MQSPDAPPVRTRAVSRSFGDHTVLRGLDLTVDAGRVHGFIGPSGSGKTTTVRMLTGVLAPSSGSVEVFGTDPRKLDTAQRKAIGYMPQLGVLYPQLSIGDNLRFAASLYGVRKPKDRIAEVLEMLDLGGKQTLTLEDASGGMQRRVALAAALLHAPRLLFLDEPTSGLDPVLRRTVWEHLQALAADGCTIFVTTQIVSEAAMCDRVGLLADGGLLAEGSPDELRRRAEGGEGRDVHADGPVTAEAMEALGTHDGVVSATHVDRDRRAVRLVVDDAEAVMDSVGEVLAAHGLSVQLTERFQAPFDDVFVSLLEQQDA